MLFCFRLEKIFKSVNSFRLDGNYDENIWYLCRFKKIIYKIAHNCGLELSFQNITSLLHIRTVWQNIRLQSAPQTTSDNFSDLQYSTTTAQCWNSATTVLVEHFWPELQTGNMLRQTHEPIIHQTCDCLYNTKFQIQMEITSNFWI